jgi:hypothetical protein
MSIHPEGKSCSDLGRVLVLHDLLRAAAAASTDAEKRAATAAAAAEKKAAAATKAAEKKAAAEEAKAEAKAEADAQTAAAAAAAVAAAKVAAETEARASHSILSTISSTRIAEVLCGMTQVVSGGLGTHSLKFSYGGQGENLQPPYTRGSDCLS